ncbi:MAG: glycine betaine ABC transporter substrate-binding protein [Corynebacterium sp.]|uniref:glycine betaine ABC transporter substrate-binding protein n=1 Tax=Corynebacterium sp. TaxID=1720 RepID=UPI003F955263
MKYLKSAAAIAASCLLLTGCGLGSAGGFTPSGELAGPVEDIDLDGADISVGSKNFTEQVLLGKMAIILLQSAGASVTDLTSVPGASTSRQAQLDGEIDFQWEYTGNGWINYLGNDDPIVDEEEQYRAVRDGDRENGLEWLPVGPMNNTYGFAATSDKAAELGVENLSDVAELPPEELTFCVESEFESRNDGFEPMLEAYGLSPDEVQTSVMDTGAVYQATADGVCNFGEVFTTDGRIKSLDLQVVDDDKVFFPKYNLSGVVRQDVLDEYPQIAELFAPVVELLDDETMIDLNARIDVDGEEPTDVALDWLEQEGFISG